MMTQLMMNVSLLQIQAVFVLPTGPVIGLVCDVTVRTGERDSLANMIFYL